MKKKEKIGEANSELLTSSLHYRATVLLITVFCLLVTCTEWIAGIDFFFANLPMKMSDFIFFTIQ